MSYKDFKILQRKEFLILCILLILITFTQIALEISNDRTKTLVQVTTFLKNDDIGLEVLGLLLPLIISLIFFIKNKSRGFFTGFSSKDYLVIIVLIYLLIVFLPTPNIPVDDEEPETNPQNITLTSSVPSSTISNKPVQPPDNNPILPEYTSIDLTFLNLFLNVFRNIVIVSFLILPVIVILIIRIKSEKKEKSPEEPVNLVNTEDQEKQYNIRSILECYYQASEVLEDKGAEDSPSLTPLEFSDDVINKKLSKPNNINDLTTLFEEAKFSDHIMSLSQVEKAKDVTSIIIFTPRITEEVNNNNIDSSNGKNSKTLENFRKGKNKNE